MLNQSNRRISRYSFEWMCLVVGAILLLSFLVITKVAVPLGNVVFDHIQRLKQTIPDSRVVIIAIDDRTIHHFNGWPLSRKLYAELLNNLAITEHKPAVIGFDLLFLDHTNQDDFLGEAGLQHRVILPISFSYDEVAQEIKEELPVESLRRATTILAQVNVKFDDDGFIRRVNLFEKNKPSLAMAMFDDKHSILQCCESLDLRFNLIPPTIGMTTISLSDVLNQHFPLSFFKDKYVLIGATAASLGDHYPTIYSGKQGTGTPGVYIQASILSNLLQNRLINTIDTGIQIGVSVTLLMIVMVGILILTPSQEIILTVIVGIGFVLFCVVALVEYDGWFDPTPLIITITMTKLLWAWRRMKMVVAYIQSRAREFQEFLPINQVLERSFLDYDGIQQYSLLMDQAIALSKSRMLYLEKIISSLPEAMVIINRYDEVLLSNSEFKNIKDTRMGTRKNIQSIIMAWGCSFNLIQQLRENPDITHALDIEVEKGNIRNFRVHIVDLTLDNSEVLWMINFIDVTAILSAQAERNRTLQFLSHDMRTPLAVIISLSTKSNKQLANLNTPDLSHKIIFYSHKVLALIDDFILSVSVEEVTHQVQVVLLETLVDDAVYQVKPLAEERNMSISWNEDVEPSFISVNTRLIIRVLVNLLSNAIRYGEAGSKIVINMAMITDDQGKSLVECAVTNYVGAINETDEKKQENLGFGLGLDFVQKVVSKHSGSMLRDIPSSAGEVATVSIKLPTV